MGIMANIHREIVLPVALCGTTALTSSDYGKCACYESGGTIAVSPVGAGSSEELAGWCGIIAEPDGAAAGKPVKVWGPGSIIPAKVKGTAISKGEYLMIDSTAAAANRGRLKTAVNAAYAVAVAEEACTEDDSLITVRLLTAPIVYSDISLVGVGNA